MVRLWYPDAVPGAHQGACCVSRAVLASRSHTSSIVMGPSQPDTPLEWLSRCRTSTSCFPLTPNSGQYLVTFSKGSSWPRSISSKTARLTTVLEDDQTFVMVSSSQALVLAASA